MPLKLLTGRYLLFNLEVDLIPEKTFYPISKGKGKVPTMTFSNAPIPAIVRLPNDNLTICHGIQSCVKTFLLSSENHPQNVPLPTQKMHHGTTFQPAIPGTWQDFFYMTVVLS